MKKIMMAVAIVCAAAAVQAASITWGSDTYKLVDKEGATLAAVPGGSIVLAIIGDNVGFAAGTWDGTVKSVLGSPATIGSGKKAGKIGEKFEFTYTGTSADPVKNGDVLAMVFSDGKGNYSQLQLQASGDAVTTTFVISGLTENDFAATPTMTSGNFMVAAIPEPTSGLLLLLGVAGLALRRRRA